jgi:DNA-binding Xre family transcriptional regulator
MSVSSSSNSIKVIHMIPLQLAATLVWTIECGENLRAVRGKTAREKVIEFLAQKEIKYSQESLRNLEIGTTQSIDVKIFLALCDFYNIPPSDLIPSALVGISNNFLSLT